MPSSRTVRICTLLLAISITLAGCGKSGPTTYSVSGTVTVAGKPMEKGRIQFVPDSTKGSEGPIAAAVITNGQYDTSAAKQGIVGGPHLVIIESGTNANPEQPTMGNQRKIAYRTTIDLPKKSSVQDFDIPASAAR